MNRASTSQPVQLGPPHIPGGCAVLEHEISQLRVILERYAGVLLDAPGEQLTAAFRELLEISPLASASDLLESLPTSQQHCNFLLDRLLDRETGFFRFPKVFHAFEKTVVPELAARKARQSPRPLRIWSAGCGTGEEPYSIAMSLCQVVSCGGGGWNIHILATDLRRPALTFAERGLYPREALATVPNRWVREFFARLGEHFLVKPRLRNLVTFTQANLVQPAYIGRFDCIFCLDVLSHFSSAQRTALLERLQLYLEPGGYLILGEEEKISSSAGKFLPQDEPFLYRKPMIAAAKSGQ